MRPDALVTIREYSRPVDAHIDRALLQDAGIDAVILNEHVAGVAPHFTLAGAQVELQVRAEDFAAARELLIGETVDSEIGPAPVCPHCGSADFTPRRSFFASIALALLGARPGNGSSGEWVCGACGAVSKLPSA